MNHLKNPSASKKIAPPDGQASTSGAVLWEVWFLYRSEQGRVYDHTILTRIDGADAPDARWRLAETAAREWVTQHAARHGVAATFDRMLSVDPGFIHAGEPVVDELTGHPSR